MSLDVLLIRQGQRLAAADPISLEALESIHEKEIVTASIRRSRNPKHHAKFFALIGAVFPHQTTYATTRDLVNALKISVGFFETGKTIDGIPYMIPKSISWASLSQTNFEQVYDRMLDVIINRILPSVDKDDLNRQVDAILAGRNA